MNFLHPEMFYLALPLLIAVAALSIQAAVRRREQLLNLLGSRADDPDAVHLSQHRRVVRIILLSIAMLCLLTAAARPWYGSQLLPYQQSGRDIMVLFDVSKSMLANDLPPSRLEHAKFLFRELVKNAKGDRFGIVPFAGNAFLLCPLTSDTVALDQYINELNTDSVPLGGTNLERALFQTSKAFEAASGNNRAVVLFTDGEELSGDSKRTLEELKKANIPLFIIGLGDPDTAAPLPDKNGTLRRDASGKLITSKLNENALKKLAQETGGIYVRSSVADTGIAAIQRRIAQLGTAGNNAGKRTLPIEKFHWFLIAGALFLFGYMILSERPASLRKALNILLLAGAFSALAAEEPLPQKEEKEKIPDQPLQLYNFAREKQLAGTENVQELYEKVIQNAPNQPELQARTFGNLGVAFHNTGRKELAAAEQKVSAQQLDAALQDLQKAETQVKNAGELYNRSLSFGLPSALNGRNIQQLANDRKKIEELKKKIEELKKQQQQAQQQTQQAQQQNKQNQQNQQNQQN
ncbi:MAG: VWA domain-containing protein, partial [Lentisphaeria bacterium]|nr:VWA domain-containing protein [Lentisphaeria bacterium]